MTGLCSVKLETHMGSNRTVLFLSVLLVVQLGLAVLLKLGEAQYKPSEAGEKLLTCDFNAVNKIIIEEMSDNDTKKKSVSMLKKEQQGWVLPDYYQFPASRENVNQLLETLKSLKKGLRVATTSGALERFKVGPHNFERSVSLLSNSKKVSTLYLGSSPHFRAVYARLSDNNDIYSVGLPVYLISAKYSDWIDRRVADIKSDDIKTIEINGLRVEGNGNNWKLKGRGQEHALNHGLTMEIVNKLAHVDINSVLGTKEEPQYNADSPALSYKITMKDGETVTYSFSKPSDAPYYILKLSNQDYYLEVDSFLVNQIRELTPEYLLKKAVAGKSKK